MLRWRTRQACIGAVAAALLSVLVTPGRVVAADGATTCNQATGNFQAGELAVSGGWERGARATIEGQPIALCYDSGPHYGPGSFE
jgi:hypothetical protein